MADPGKVFCAHMIQRDEKLCAEAANGKLLRAIYDCVGDAEDELSFKYGDIITLVDNSDPEWWTGCANGIIGLFPSSYVDVWFDKAEQQESKGLEEVVLPPTDDSFDPSKLSTTIQTPDVIENLPTVMRSVKLAQTPFQQTNMVRRKHLNHASIKRRPLPPPPNTAQAAMRRRKSVVASKPRLRVRAPLNDDILDNEVTTDSSAVGHSKARHGDEPFDPLEESLLFFRSEPRVGMMKVYCFVTTQPGVLCQAIVTLWN